MSIKIYNGYRKTFSDGFDLLRWQYDLTNLRSKLEEEAKDFVSNALLQRALHRMDCFHAGLPIENPEASHLSWAYQSVENDCRALRKGQHCLILDTEVNLCWKLIPDNSQGYQTVLCLVYAERPYVEKVVHALGLEDYHYQNQTDPDEGVTWEGMVERGELWEEALGGNWANPPTAFFHNFVLCPPPEAPLLGWMPVPPVLIPPPLAERASRIGFKVLYQDLPDDGDTVHARARLHRDVKEGGPMHSRMQEVITQVAPKLIADPTLEDLKEKPSEVSLKD